MKFCDICVFFMETTIKGYYCHRCGNEIMEPRARAVRRAKDSPSEGIYVVNKSEDDSLRVNQTCPRCGHHEAYRRVSFISGEHAGIKQDGVVERYRCARCLTSWTLS